MACTRQIPCEFLWIWFVGEADDAEGGWIVEATDRRRPCAQFGNGRSRTANVDTPFVAVFRSTAENVERNGNTCCPTVIGVFAKRLDGVRIP